MNTRLRFALFLTLSAFLPTLPLAAQDAPRTPHAGPRLEHTAAAMRGTTPDAGAAAVAQVQRNSVGKPVALMIIGGAAIVLGSTVVDGDVGTLFAIGGAVALLYGLYLYLR